MRSVRVGHWWDDAEAIAKADGENMADLIDRLLSRYVKARERREKQQQPTDD